jgi:hypothetical protein
MADVFTAFDVVYGLLAAGALAMVAFAHRELRAARLLIILAALLLSARWIMWSFVTDQSWPARSLIGAMFGALILGGLPTLYSWARDRGQTSQGVPEVAAVPVIEVTFEPQPPYETTEITNGRVLSTVRIGLKAPGNPISNCRLYIEKIAPEPPLPGGLPILLQGGDFILRRDDPEKLVDIASHWNHVAQWRFNSPPGWYAEQMNYIDDGVPRVIEIKIKATELERAFLFKIWTDESKRLHLERM